MNYRVPPCENKRHAFFACVLPHSRTLHLGSQQMHESI